MVAISIVSGAVCQSLSSSSELVRGRNGSGHGRQASPGLISIFEDNKFSRNCLPPAKVAALQFAGGTSWSFAMLLVARARAAFPLPTLFRCRKSSRTTTRKSDWVMSGQACVCVRAATASAPLLSAQPRARAGERTGCNCKLQRAAAAAAHKEANFKRRPQRICVRLFVGARRRRARERTFRCRWLLGARLCAFAISLSVG